MVAAIDITGQKFGKLTALGPTERRSNNGEVVWQFVCECGALVEKPGTTIKHNAKRCSPSCGGCSCVGRRKPSNVPVKLEIAGQKFGRLLALEPTGKTDMRRYVIWKFRCDCGQVVERSAGSVVGSARRGSNPSCGARGCRADQSRNITGERFGSLVAVQPTDRRDGHRSVIWQFRCDCGEIVERSVSSFRDVIQAGNIPSCRKATCCNRQSLGNGIAAKRRVIASYKRAARTRGLVFELDTGKMDKLFSGTCHYCDASPSTVGKPAQGTFTGNFIYNGIDRVDSDKGYTDDNVVSCCYECNRAKMNTPVSEFLAWAKRLASYQGW